MIGTGNTGKVVGLRSRVGWGVAAQGLSSASNFLVGLVVVRSVSLADFGSFSVAYSVYLLAAGVFRAFGGKAYAIRFTTSSTEDQRRAQSALAGLALLSGFVFGALCLVGSSAVGGTLAQVLRVLAILLPGLLLQDAWRFSFVATGRPARAVVNDATWLMSQLIAFSAVALLTVPTAPLLLGVWGLAGGVAGLLGIAQSGVVPSLSRAVAFAREHRDLNWHLAGEQLVSQGANQLGVFVLAGLLPLASIGALRSGQLILSPLNVMQQAAPLVGLPEARRGAERSSGALVRSVTVLAVVLATAPVLLALGIGMVPASVGTWAFGDGWEAGLSVLAALTVRNVAGGVALACFVGLHALERTTQTMAIGAVRGGASLVLAVAAAAVAGLHAAVWAMAIADIAGAVVAVLVLRAAVHPTAPTDPIGPSREARR